MKLKLLTIMLLLIQTLWAQNLTVVSFSPSTDVDASVHRVNDLNGQACALVKVMTTDEMINAKGASVITLSNGKTFQKKDANEYWVYLAKGARHLTVATQNYLPLKIDFQDYGITTLEGLRTYVLQLNVNKQENKQRLTIKYSPSDAVVLIDSKVCQGQNGIFQTTLAPGNHKVIVSCSGYNPFDVTAEIKDAPVSLYAYLDKITALEEAVTPQAPSTPSASSTYGDTSPDASQTFTVGGVSFKMIRVDGGTFMMGATPEQVVDAERNENPAHSVTLSSYYIGETEVTQELWQAVMGKNPSEFKGAILPVEDVSYKDCQKFIVKLSKMTGRNFRLPTEAEWEFAARGGTRSTGYKYSGSNDIDMVAWYTDNSGSWTHEVKTKAPNELGIYDMSGNVCEWCQDWYGDYSSLSQTNPTGASKGNAHVYRGGDWNFNTSGCRVSYRGISMSGGGLFTAVAVGMVGAAISPGGQGKSFGLRLAL